VPVFLALDYLVKRTIIMAAPIDLKELEIRQGLDGLTPARILTLYRRAPLLRPVADPAEVWKMYENASLVLTAWHRGHLAGVARILTDGVLYSYLCDLAVEPDVQGLGVGRQLIDEMMSICSGTEIVLRDSDISAGFYEHLGFVRVTNAWVRRSR
jgi:ribosomal protein S18 acetylase RimI-like enzyme